MSSSNFNIIVGGSIISKKKLNELSKADQQVLLDTAKRAAAKELEALLNGEADANDTFLEINAGANAAAWNAAAKKAREQLAARGVYSKSLLKAVETAAKN
jgi:TRAP-type C4-dicarboxylate transport system substrate-binding protein